MGGSRQHGKQSEDFEDDNEELGAEDDDEEDDPDDPQAGQNDPETDNSVLATFDKVDVAGEAEWGGYGGGVTE